MGAFERGHAAPLDFGFGRARHQARNTTHSSALCIATVAILACGALSGEHSMSSGDGLQQVSKIVNSFFNKPETLAFREPVNPKAMGIPDYPQIVKNPMDLGTVSCAADATISLDCLLEEGRVEACS